MRRRIVNANDPCASTMKTSFRKKSTSKQRYDSAKHIKRGYEDAMLNVHERHVRLYDESSMEIRKKDPWK